MPVYNSATYLRESIESILNQTFTEFEFIIIDDGSSDNSVSIIKSYTDNRIVLLTKPENSGIANSFNLGIANAKGKYIARMDSDDISVKNRLHWQVQHMEAHPDLLAIGGAYKILDSEIQFNPPINYEEVKVYSIIDLPVANPTIFFRRDVFNKNNLLYDRSFEPAEDFEMVSRLIDIGKVENLPQVLLYYRKHNTQSTARKAENQINAVERIRIRQLDKLTSFQNKPYNHLLAINILRHKEVNFTPKLVDSVMALIEDILSTNVDKKFYNDQLLYNYLRSGWLHFFYHSNISILGRFQIFLAARKIEITRISVFDFFWFSAKKSIKKILKW